MDAESGIRAGKPDAPVSRPAVGSGWARLGNSGKSDRRIRDIPLAPGLIDRRVMPEKRLPSLQFVKYEDFIFSQLVAASHGRHVAKQINAGTL